MEMPKPHKTKNRRRCQHQSWPRWRWPRHMLRDPCRQHTGRSACLYDTWKKEYQIQFKEEIFHISSVYLKCTRTQPLTKRPKQIYIVGNPVNASTTEAARLTSCFLP